MPMRKPSTAAITAPNTMARARRRGEKPTLPWRAMAKAEPAKAPMLMKPAWPRLSSPEMPTTRFRDRAMTM